MRNALAIVDVPPSLLDQLGQLHFMKYVDATPMLTSLSSLYRKR